MTDKLSESEAAKSEAMDNALSAEQDNGQETQMESTSEDLTTTTGQNQLLKN